MHYTTSLQTTSWLSSEDHCDWYGVTCDDDYNVISIDLNSTSWSGPYPTELKQLSKLEELSTSGNTLTGDIPTNICDHSENGNLYLIGDETNCPNVLGTAGCCDEVKLTSPSPYLEEIVASKLGSADCTTFAATSADAKVCEFMKNKENHYLFHDDNNYPDNSFPFIPWLEVSLIGISRRLFTLNELSFEVSQHILTQFGFDIGTPHSCPNLLRHIFRRYESCLAWSWGPL